MLKKRFICIFSTLLWASLLSVVHAAGFHCWTNEDDVKECGSVIPPQYVKKEHVLRDDEGRVIKKVDAEKSPEERRAIIRKQHEEEEALRRAEEQEKTDQALLDAYPTAGDILVACNGKAASVNAAILVTKNQLEFYRRTLVEAENALAHNKTPALVKHVNGLQRQIADAEKIILTKEQEKVNIATQHQKFIDRYIEVKRRTKKDYSPIALKRQLDDGDRDNFCNLKISVTESEMSADEW